MDTNSKFLLLIGKTLPPPNFSLGPVLPFRMSSLRFPFNQSSHGISFQKHTFLHQTLDDQLPEGRLRVVNGGRSVLVRRLARWAPGKTCALESRMCSRDKLEPLLRLLGSNQGSLALIVKKSQSWHRGHPVCTERWHRPQEESAPRSRSSAGRSVKDVLHLTRSSIFNLTLRDAL